MSNPDHFPKGRRVTLSKLGKEQVVLRKRGAIGVVTSPWPISQVVTVKWAHLKSPQRLHVDYLRAPPMTDDDTLPTAIAARSAADLMLCAIAALVLGMAAVWWVIWSAV